MEAPVLVVMAAGIGSRYGGTKQLDAVGEHGQALLHYSLYDARRAGFRKAVFVIRPDLLDPFREQVGARIGDRMEVEYVFQRLEDLPEGYAPPEGRVKPWGTAQAVLAARGAVDGSFAVINADDYYGPAAFRTLYDYLSAHPDGARYEYAMVGYRLENTLTENGYVSRGVCRETAEHCLVEIRERTRIERGPRGPRFMEGGVWTDLPGDAIVSMNLWGFHKSFLDEAWARFPAFLDRAADPLKDEYYLPAVVSQLICEDKARVRVLRSGDRWYGVTYREDRPAVSSAIREKTRSGLYPDDLWG